MKVLEIIMKIANEGAGINNENHAMKVLEIIMKIVNESAGI